jgi:hypothetical protein
MIPNFTGEAMAELDLGKVKILPRLADRLDPEHGDPIPDDLIGAKIVAIGCMAPPEAVEGGGLAIDYRKPGSETTQRVVFEFNELGMWVAFPPR